MTVHLSIRDRIRDDVALYDITRQTAKTVLVLLRQRLAASTDTTETEYWQVRIAGVEEAEAALGPGLPALQILAQQDRWVAEADQLLTMTGESPSDSAW
jgi:hypothetical protein